VKTKTSVRTVEIPDVVAGPLADHVAQGVTPVSVDDHTDHRNPVRREALLLFRGASGEALNAATFSRTWATARAAVGLPPRWGIHGLRHYYATVLIHAGASVKTVELALGHSSRPSP
jgi:integrase